MIKFSRISHRLLAVVGSVVIIGLVGLALIYANRQEKSILEENEQALIKVTESVAEGLSAIMLQGHAKIGKEFADRLKKVKDILDYRILRADGTEAFVDNSTVAAVNRKLEEEEFRGRKNDPDPVQVILRDDPRLKRVLESRGPVFHYETMANNERIVTILAPIEVGPKCGKCHQDKDTLRGVIKLTTSLSQVQHDIESTWRLSAILISVALVMIGVGIYVIAHKIVVTHLNSIAEAMDQAAKGDLSVKVRVNSQDEIGHMARSFNHMSQELVQMYQGLTNEKSKLATLIEGAKEGIVVTNAAGEVVLVNSAAQELLEKSEQLIKHEGFFYLFDNEDWMLESIELSHTNNAPRLLSWHGRILSIKASTIHNEENQIIGSAALIRDITEEKRLEEELKKRSVTDGLTGLYNRRHFDKTLETEFKRWQRYKTPLSLIMFDVDHFKKFNDAYGHECGDQVLISLAKVLRNHASPNNPNVMAFRYGGEEMIMIAANTPQEEATKLAEKLRLEVADLVIEGLRITISVGVAGTPAHSPKSGEALLKLADDALYDAKHEGRNQVRVAQPYSETSV